MELIKSIRNAIQFILSIQESCDKRRKSLENIWLHEYTSYINDWKQNQIELKKNTGKKSLESNELKDEELEELALADELLRKARSIRMKNQKTMNGIIDHMNIPTSRAISGVLIKKSSDQTIEKSKSKRQMPQSKSESILPRLKRTIVPRSKSASVLLTPKENFKSYYNNKKCSSLSAKCSTTNLIESSENTSKDSNAISSKDLDVLKRLHVSLPTCHEIKPKRNSTFSDSSEDNNQHQISSEPSSREFLLLIKGKVNAVSSQFKLKVWYPFLSSESEMFLTSVQCNTFCSMKEACSVLHIIQETMMWIDLLYLMEKEIYPNIVFDNRDVKKLRVLSYLQSIFIPNGQRIPMISPVTQ